MIEPSADAFVRAVTNQHHNCYDIAHKCEITLGEWATEADSATAFDQNVPEMFEVYKEVRGTLISPRPAQIDRSMRIDRVLIPKRELLDLGWKYGIVGVELKRSKEKIGPAIAQAMDYSRTVWTLEPTKFQIWLNYVFIWPMAKQSGTIASICAQQRIGSAYGADEYVQFGLKVGETGIFELRKDGRRSIGKVEPGTKAGSR
jgi:hypothetical protein